MPTPCYNDPRFISDDPAVMQEAASLCFDCPVFDECDQLGIGEPAGVYAGRLPSDPARKAHRLRETNRAVACRNGHPAEQFGVDLGMLVSQSNPTIGCTACASLNRTIVDRAC